MTQALRKVVHRHRRRFLKQLVVLLANEHRVVLFRFARAARIRTAGRLRLAGNSSVMFEARYYFSGGR